MITDVHEFTFISFWRATGKVTEIEMVANHWYTQIEEAQKERGRMLTPP